MRSLSNIAAATVAVVLTHTKAFGKMLALMACALLMPLAAEGITLPDTGVDVPGHVTAFTASYATVVLAVVGAMVAFWIVWKGIRLMRRVR